jgi:hypothetical protein
MEGDLMNDLPEKKLSMICELAGPRSKVTKPIDRLIGIGFTEEEAKGICNRWICDLDILDITIEKIENKKAFLLTDEQVKNIKGFVLTVDKWHPKKRQNWGGAIV